jgi:hypothetical protein
VSSVPGRRDDVGTTAPTFSGGELPVLFFLDEVSTWVGPSLRPAFGNAKTAKWAGRRPLPYLEIVSCCDCPAKWRPQPAALAIIAAESEIPRANIQQISDASTEIFRCMS